MPLHGKQTFIKKPPPQGLKPTDKVFYNELTGEIFDDYEEYFHRTVVCKSLVWSCELTLNSRLTYSDALESERKARQCLKTMPESLKRGMLFAIGLTHRGRLVDLWEDVWAFVKDRYFVGEEVEALIDGQWIDCKVRSVLPPRDSDLVKSKQKKVSNPKENEEIKKEEADEGEPEEKGEKEKGNPSHEAWPTADIYRYHLEEIPYEDSEDSDDETEKKEQQIPKRFIVPAEDIKRARGIFTRAKNKLYVKFVTEINSEGLLVVKKMAADKHHLGDMKIEDVFVGPKPVFQVGTKAKRKNKVANGENGEKVEKKKGRPPSTGTKQGDIRKFMEKGSSGKAKDSPKPSTPKTETIEERKKRLEEEIKARVEADKKRRTEEKERKKEEKKLYNELLKDWHKPKEDLELEDLQDLPPTTAVNCRVPNELFGGLLETLEFFTVFHKTLEFGNYFPSGITFEKVEEAICDQDMRGGLHEILVALLETIFQLQENEDLEISSGSDKPDASLKEQFSIGSEENALAKAVELATAAASWPKRYLGTALSNLPRDPCTVSEILRLHLLSSGAQCSENIKNWKFQERGGYTSQDDPGIQFRLEHGDILQKLTSKLVFQLTPAEKVNIVSCLISQVMTYVNFRDALDENFEKMTSKRKELVQIKANEKKKAREEASQRMKEKKEAKKEGKPVEPAVKQEEEEQSGRKETRKATEETRKKDEAGRKERDLLSSIASLQVQCALFPLGRDRAYRRFWTCTSVPGIFVEDNDEFVGPCLSQPTPLPIKGMPSGKSGEKQEDIRKFLTMHKGLLENGSRSPENGSSDKENDDDNSEVRKPKDPVVRTYQRKTGEVFGQSSNKTLDGTIPGPVVKLETCPDADAKRVELKEEKMEFGAPVFGMCMGQGHEDECPVHSMTLKRTVWSFYSSAEEVDALIQGLNPRGYREKELRDRLLMEKDRLISRLERCPIGKLDISKANLGTIRPEPRQKSDRRNKSATLALLSYANHPPGTPSEFMINLCFRDRLLEMEDKIHIGNLGTLKVGDREAWRKAVVDGTYDQQCESLIWAGGQYKEKQVLLTPRKEKPVVKEEPEDVEEKETKLKIRQLAAALLQLEQSVEPRYMQPPLGETASEKSKKKAQEEGDSSDSSEEEEEEGDGEKKPEKVKLTPLQRWELSLKNVSSFSQLFVHLEALNNSVMWSRSTLHARCKVCRKKGDEQLLLLCDGCNCGWHTTCLKPKLKAIPRGDWFCQNCKPAQAEPQPAEKRRPPRRRTFSEVQSESEEEEDEETEEEAEPEEEEDDTIQGEDEEEEEKSDAESEQEEEEEEDDETIETDVCDGCGESGELVVCSEDKCAKQYHLECVDPPLKKMPRGMWVCPKCVQKSSRGSKRTSGRDSRKAEKRSLEIEPRAQHKRRGAAVAAEGKIHEATRRLQIKNLDMDSEDDEDYEEEMDEEEETTTRRSAGTSTRRSDRKIREDVDFDTAVMESLLKSLTKHDDAWPFMRPVTKKDAPDYFDRIRRPMDFGTLKGNLSKSAYKSNEDFLSDIQLIFDNCREYNEEDTQIYECADSMEKFFREKLDELGLSHFYEGGPASKRSKRF